MKSFHRLAFFDHRMELFHASLSPPYIDHVICGTPLSGAVWTKQRFGHSRPSKSSGATSLSSSSLAISILFSTDSIIRPPLRIAHIFYPLQFCAQSLQTPGRRSKSSFQPTSPELFPLLARPTAPSSMARSSRPSSSLPYPATPRSPLSAFSHLPWRTSLLPSSSATSPSLCHERHRCLVRAPIPWPSSLLLGVRCYVQVRNHRPLTNIKVVDDMVSSFATLAS